MGKSNEQSLEKMSVKSFFYAIFCMLIGCIPGVFFIGVLGYRIGWLGGFSVGLGVTVGYEIGEGKSGWSKRIVVSILSLIGAVFTIQIGYAIHLLAQIPDATFISSLGFVRNVVIEGLQLFITGDGLITGSVQANILQDLALTIILAIVVSLMKWGIVKRKN